MNFYHFIEFKRPVDDGLECTIRKTLDDIFHSELPRGVAEGYLKETVPLDGCELGVKFQYRYLSVTLAEVTVDLHDAATT